MQLDPAPDVLLANHAALSRRLGTARVLRRVRPTSLAGWGLALLSQRKIIEAEGLRLFIDPTTHLGDALLTTGTYEPETIRIFRDCIKPGAVVLDIGANEGFFSALAAKLAGAAGTIIAIEPQSRLMDVLNINLKLNASGHVRIFKNVVGTNDGVVRQISLFPISNTGATSLVSSYRFGAKTEAVVEKTPPVILAECGVERVNFVKIDVEGFEPEVIEAALPLLQQGRIDRLLLDYHRAILAKRGIDADRTHGSIVACGYRALEGSIGDGYVLYRHMAAD